MPFARNFSQQKFWHGPCTRAPISEDSPEWQNPSGHEYSCIYRFPLNNLYTCYHIIYQIEADMPFILEASICFLTYCYVSPNPIPGVFRLTGWFWSTRSKWDGALCVNFPFCGVIQASFHLPPSRTWFKSPKSLTDFVTPRSSYQHYETFLALIFGCSRCAP